MMIESQKKRESLQQKASFQGWTEGYHSEVKRVLICLAGMLLALVARAEQPSQYDPFFYNRALPPGYVPGQGPTFLYYPQGTPESPVPQVGLFDPDRPFAQPVARVDGQPVRRPLFPSQVSDSVERALILHDYRQSGFRLPGFELGLAFKRYQQAQFHGLPALRDARLQKEHATLDDYRQYVAEETEISAMLSMHCHGAVKWTEMVSLRKDYLTRLRHKAVVEPLTP